MIANVDIYTGIVIIILLIGTVSWLIVIRFGNSISITDQFGFLALAYFCLWIFFKTIFDDNIWDVMVNNIKGKKGEDLIAKCLSENFDDSYTYLRNITLPDDKIGDIDGLLINSKEIVIIEVKYFTGKFKIKDGIFHKLKGSYLSPFGLPHDPIKQAERQRLALTEYLNQKGFHPHIRPFVALAHGKVVGIDGPTSIYVLSNDNLIPKLKEEFASTVNLPNQSAEEIVGVLRM